MSDEIINTQSGQTGDLAGNAVQPNVNGFQQASGNVQSPDFDRGEWEKAILAKAYQQTQSLISKSENRQSSNFQGMIDQFKRDYGVTLTEQQAQEMAQNQAAKSMQNVPMQAQAPRQTAPATDPAYQGFMYYHGMRQGTGLDAEYRQMYQLQNTLGVQLEKTDEEYQKFAHPEKKYANKAELVNAWKQACLDKMVRLKSEQAQPSENQKGTNLGQMPLVGSRGGKANNYDPKRSPKSYFSEYMKDKKL